MVGPFGREAQRRKVAGALVVIFKEEAVDLHLVEEDLGDRLIAALGDPRALEVAATQMHRNHHVFRPLADRVVDELAVEMDERVGIVAARFCPLADFGIAEVSKVGVVELQIAAAARCEVVDFGAIGGGEIVVEIFEPGIDARADRLAPAAEMQHRRRRDAHFCRARRLSFQEVEVGALDRLTVADLSLDVHGRRLEADLRPVVLAEFCDELAVMGLDAVELLEEIDVEIRCGGIRRQ